MKKLLLCTAALTMFAGSALAFNGSNVKADDAKNSANGSDPITNTFLNIDNSTNITKPVDPLSPNNELSGNNIKSTGAKGELTLDAVPDKLDFGTANNQDEKGISVETLNNIDHNKYYYAQVTDNRPGAKGWNLSASMSPMLDDDSKQLENASITFNSDSKAKPAYKNYNNSIGADKAPDNKNANLQPNTSENIMTANTGEGQFTWFDYFNSIQLKYASQAYGGNYKGQITWHLTSNLGSNGLTSGTSSNPVGTEQNNSHQKTNVQ